MSTLTKVFALLISALAIFLCGVVSTFLMTAEDYKAYAESWKTKAEAAALQAVAAEERLNNFKGEQEIIAEGLRNNISTLQSLYNERTRQWNDAMEAGKQEAARAATAVQTMAALQTTVENMQSSIKDLWDAHNVLIADKRKAEVAKADAEHKLNLSSAKNELLEDTRRLHVEKIAELENTIVDLNQQLEKFKVASSDFTSTNQVSLTPIDSGGVPIRGEIIDIRDDKAAISVGSSSGVRKNMRFWITRGDKFLGKLQILMVEADEAVGRLDNLQGVIVVGDSVTTGFDY